MSTQMRWCKSQEREQNDAVIEEGIDKWLGRGKYEMWQCLWESAMSTHAIISSESCRAPLVRNHWRVVFMLPSLEKKPALSCYHRLLCKHWAAAVGVPLTPVKQRLSPESQHSLEEFLTVKENSRLVPFLAR